MQNLRQVQLQIREQEQAYLKKRDKEKQEAKKKLENPNQKEKSEAKESKPGFDGRWYTDINNTMYVKIKKVPVKGNSESQPLWLQVLVDLW